jgi:hypothetical protein
VPGGGKRPRFLDSPRLVAPDPVCWVSGGGSQSTGNPISDAVSLNDLFSVQTPAIAPAF